MDHFLIFCVFSSPFSYKKEIVGYDSLVSPMQMLPFQYGVINLIVHVLLSIYSLYDFLHIYMHIYRHTS